MKHATPMKIATVGLSPDSVNNLLTILTTDHIHEICDEVNLTQHVKLADIVIQDIDVLPQVRKPSKTLCISQISRKLSRFRHTMTRLRVQKESISRVMGSVLVRKIKGMINDQNRRHGIEQQQVLIIEQDINKRKKLISKIQAKGYAGYVVENPELALEQIKSGFKYDCILLGSYEKNHASAGNLNEMEAMAKADHINILPA